MQIRSFVAPRVGAMTMGTIKHEQFVALVRGCACAWNHQRIGSAHLHLGEHEEARAAFQIALSLFEERLRLGADDPYTRFYVAGIHALRGEPEQALSSLGRAVKGRRRFNVARARIEPEFASLRDDQRFKELVTE